MTRVRNVIVNTGILCTILLLFGGCPQKKVETGEGIREGIITYQIRFPELESNSFIASMLPGEIKTYFKDTKVRTEMQFGFGIMKTVGISDSKGKTSFVLMDLFDKKYLVNNSNLDADGNGLPNYELTPTAESKEIAGMNCHMIRVKDLDNNNEFDIFQTDDISVSDIYWNTPYKGTDGALMSFPVTANQISMNLMAKNVTPKELEDDLFSIPDGYEKITQQEFEEILDGLISGEM